MARIILVTGSRAASPVMLQTAQTVVQWIAEKGYTLIVGDAGGIDAEVRMACQEIGLTPHVYGAYGTIRQPWLNPSGEWRHVVRGGYLARDRQMAYRCHWCIAIWDGVSRGTKYTGEYAAALGRKVIWRIFAD